MGHAVVKARMGGEERGIRIKGTVVCGELRRGRGGMGEGGREKQGRHSTRTERKGGGGVGVPSAKQARLCHNIAKGGG